MKKYMVTFFGGNMALRYDKLDKAEEDARKNHLAAWNAWMTGLVKEKILEVGYPLESSGKRVDSNGTGDHIFPENTEGGFIIINTESLDEAAKIAQSAPIIKNGGYVLVRPCGKVE